MKKPMDRRLSISEISSGQLPKILIKEYMLYKDSDEIRKILKLRLLESYDVENKLTTDLESASDTISNEIHSRLRIVSGWINGFRIKCCDREFDYSCEGVDVLTTPIGMIMWDFDNKIYKRVSYDYYSGIDKSGFKRREVDHITTRLNLDVIKDCLINEK